MQPLLTQRFEYRLPASRMALMGLMSLLLPAIFVYLASANRRGLRIVGLTLSPDQAMTLFWTAAALSLIGAAVVLTFITRGLRGPHFVLLGASEAVLPRASLRAELVKVPYGKIQRTSVVAVPGGQMVVIQTSQGEFRIGSIGFRNEREFEKFARLLSERTSAP